MSSVITEVLSDIRDDLSLLQLHPERLRRLFNQCQRELAVYTESINFGQEFVLNPYTSESGTAVDTTNTLQVTAALDNASTDYYNGWWLINTTRKLSARIVDTTVSGNNVILKLSRAIPSQATDDTFYVERVSKYARPHHSLIRPYQHEGVYWDDNELDPVSYTEIVNDYREASYSSGTPGKYAWKEPRLWIFPQPSSIGTLRVYGSRRSVDAFYTSTTSSGAIDGSTLVSTNIPQQADDYYVGGTIEIRSGSLREETQIISDYDGEDSKFWFEEPFSGQVGNDVNIELLPMISEDAEPAIKEFVTWKSLSRSLSEKNVDAIIMKERLRRMREAESRYYAYREELDSTLARKLTTFAFVGNRRDMRTTRAIITSTER